MRYTNRHFTYFYLQVIWFVQLLISTNFLLIGLWRCKQRTYTIHNQYMLHNWQRVTRNS